MGKSRSGLRPQDILVLLKVLVLRGEPWKQMDLASSLGLSRAEVTYSLERLRRAGLVNEEKKKILRLAVVEFVVHGLKYFYPAEFGSQVRGIPTGHSFGPLKGKIVSEEGLGWVWADADGLQKGMALEPIYESVPFAAKQDSALHEMLSLVDSLRAGSSRERKMADLELRKRILGSSRKNK